MVQTENNICAVYSESGDHGKAIDHGIMALKVIDKASVNNAIIDLNDEKVNPEDINLSKLKIER